MSWIISSEAPQEMTAARSALRSPIASANRRVGKGEERDCHPQRQVDEQHTLVCILQPPEDGVEGEPERPDRDGAGDLAKVRGPLVRDPALQVVESCLRHANAEHERRDRDRDHAVAECFCTAGAPFGAPFGHPSGVSSPPAVDVLRL